MLLTCKECVLGKNVPSYLPQVLQKSKDAH